MVSAIEDKLRASGHPYIIGSECDVLSMPGYEKIIMEKVMAFTRCGCARNSPEIAGERIAANRPPA
jgi:hypothetical protein